jgi:hypothetical protein
VIALVRPPACDWCAGRAEDDPAALCIDHLAEHEGETVDSLYRSWAEQAADLL